MKVLALLAAVLGVCSASIERRSFSCGNSGNFLTTDNGVIDSHAGFAAGHHYGKNMDCTWTIEAPRGMYVELWAESFDIEQRARCPFDYLELLDGDTTSTTKRLGKYCGSNFTPISSTQNFLTLHFVTGRITQRSGFRLHYNFTNVIVSVCHSSQFHCNNTKCVSRRYQCDMDDDCGDDSDEAGCIYTTTLPTTTPCAADQFDCRLGFNRCIPQFYVCDGDYDCTVTHLDERGCNSTTRHPFTLNAANCGQTSLTGSGGTLKSPNYPSNYETNAVCNWTIQAAPLSTSLAFNFGTNFNLERSITCQFDYVEIHSSTSSLKFGPYCGNSTIPGTMTVPGDGAYVVFRSDYSNTFHGFQLTWAAS